MILNILVSFFVLVILLLAYIVFKTPKIFKISRSIMIKASAENLFPFINNARKIQDWNPFTQGDPMGTVQFAGAAEGVGAAWSWDGPKMGAGQAAIVESNPNLRVALRLDFKRPFKVINFGDYVLSASGAETFVTWTINESALLPRVLSLFMNLDRMIGSEFEKGLLILKSLAEERT